MATTKHSDNNTDENKINTTTQTAQLNLSHNDASNLGETLHAISLAECLNKDAAKALSCAIDKTATIMMESGVESALSGNVPVGCTMAAAGALIKGSMMDIKGHEHHSVWDTDNVSPLPSSNTIYPTEITSDASDAVNTAPVSSSSLITSAALLVATGITALATPAGLFTTTVPATTVPATTVPATTEKPIEKPTEKPTEKLGEKQLKNQQNTINMQSKSDNALNVSTDKFSIDFTIDTPTSIAIGNLMNKSNETTFDKIISGASSGPTLSQAEKAKSSSHSNSDRSGGGGGGGGGGWCQSDRSGSWDHGGGGRSFGGGRDRN